MAGDREELDALRRLADLEARADPTAPMRAVAAIPGKIDQAVERGAYKAGERVADFATNMGASPEVAAGAGYVANVGLQAVPAIATGSIVGKLASPAMRSGAERLMQSAVKPGLKARETGDASKAINTMLEKGINATEGGMAATQAKVTSLENNIQTILNSSPATVNKQNVAGGVQKALNEVRLNLDVVQNEDDIRKAAQKFIDHPALRQYGNDIPVSVLNQMKQAFYKELKERAYDPRVQLTAADKGQKAIASKMRTEIAAAEPAIVPTLKDQSELINVLKVAGPQVRREGNKNIVGLGWLSPSMEKTAMWMLDRYPWFKSFLARTTFQGREAIPNLVSGTAVAGAEAVSKNE